MNRLLKDFFTVIVSRILKGAASACVGVSIVAIAAAAPAAAADSSQGSSGLSSDNPLVQWARRAPLYAPGDRPTATYCGFATGSVTPDCEAGSSARNAAIIGGVALIDGRVRESLAAALSSTLSS